MIVGVLALTVALAGTAIAVPVATTSKSTLTQADKRKINKLAKKQARRQIKRKAPGLSVRRAETAGSAATADAATSADSATTADSAAAALTAGFATSAGSAAPFAYARVVGSTAVVSEQHPSRNITTANITHPEAGVYCFDLPFTPTTAAATSQADPGSDDIAMVELRPAGSSTLNPCPGSPEARVINYDVSAAGHADDSFYVQFHK